MILNDKTFQELKNSLGPDYQFRYYLFNGDHPENSKAFQDELLGKIVTLNNGEIFDSYQEAAVQDKISGYSDVIIPMREMSFMQQGNGIFTLMQRLPSLIYFWNRVLSICF